MNIGYYATLGLNEPWAIHPEYAQGYLPILSALLKGEASTNQTDNSAERLRNKSFFVSADADGFDDEDLNHDLTSAPEGSVAVLNLRGPIMKYSQFCGPIGTMDLAAELKKIDADSNFIGTLMVVESGGGQAFAIKVLTDQMDKRTKPLVVLGGNVVASAAYAISVHADEIVVDHPRAVIGSIGTMNFIQNIQPALEKMGVEFHEIYATESVLKNNTFNQALKGNYSPIRKNSLDPLNKDFQEDVKAQRPGMSTNKTILQGETFMATVALELGMIDHLGDRDFALSRVRELAKQPKKNNSKTQPSNNMEHSFKNVLALAGISTPTESQMSLANAELTLAGITHIALVEESFMTEAAAVTTERDALQTANTQLTTDLGTANTTIQTMTTAAATATARITELEGQVAAFGKNAGAVHNGKTGDDVQADADNKDSAAVISNLSHNKAANEALGN